MKSRKKRRLEREASPETAMLYRSVGIDQNGQIDAEKRSIPLVLATESPIEAFDFERMKVIREVIKLDGMELPKQIPLIDSHRSGSVLNALGSIRDLKVDGERLIGRAYFASHPDAVRTFEAYQSGHLTDFSVGATRTQVAWQGETKVVTRSRLVEGSAVVAGADPDAKAMGAARRAYLDPHGMRKEAMLEELKAMCVERGAPDNLDEAGYLAWVKENTVKRQASPASIVPEPKPDPTPNPATLNRADVVKEVLARINGIADLCRQHGIEPAQQKAWIESDIGVDAVASEILRRKVAPPKSQPLGGAIVMGEAQSEKVFNAARDGLVMRCLHGRVNPAVALERAKAAGDLDAITRCSRLVEIASKPAPGAEEFRHANISDIARRFLEETGVRTFGMTRDNIVRSALRSQQILRSDGAYNTTGTFANLLLDASNKTLLAAYDEAPTSYGMWVRTAPSAPDFKALNRIRFGELPDPEVVPENAPYKEKATTDAKESYKVQKYGELFSITWEALINDDLDAIARIPAMQGNAMRRKINKVCYAVLTANAALSDGVALFHASSHGANLDTNALSVANLNVGYAVMRQQAGLTSGTVLNIAPRYLIVPAALAATAYQIQGSLADPAAGGSAAGNSNTANIYGPNGPRRLVIVEEGQLDANSATAWYLAADPSQVDTVELTFLQGEESPVLEREMGFEVDAVKYKIRQTFAAKAIDYRGLYQGNT